MRLGDSTVEIIDGDRGKNYPNEFTDNGYCLFLSAKNVTLTGFVFGEMQFITKERDELLRKGKLSRNDVILTTRGTVGNVAFYDDDVPFENMRINSGMVILRSNPQVIIPKFLYCVMKSSDIQNQITQMRTGSAQPQFPISHMVNLEIPVPTLPEQRAIAATLSCLDDKIELNNRMNKTLEEMAQAIFKSWFVDFELFGGVMPEGWRKGVLEDICAYNSERIAVDSLTKQTYISTENMLANKSGFIDAASLPTIAQTTMFKTDDILISNIRPYFKKIVYCTFAGGCSTDVLCFRPAENMSHYLYCILFCDSFFDFMVSGSKGTKMPRGDKQQIMTYPIILPTNDTLIDFSKIIEPILSHIAVNKNENIHLGAIRDALLPKLMSGEIYIK